jgi:glycerol-3-phosphate acyltransferase PlsY
LEYGKEILVVVAGYLLGCVCAGYYLVRLRTGNDIRKSGSGSTGARNVSRTLGKSGYALTLAADIAKGVIAVGLAMLLNVERWAVVMTFLAVVIGHVWPIQLRFRGGKGVAVMLGALMVFDYRLLIVLVAVCALLYLFTRKYIISGMVGVFSLLAAAVALNYPMTEMIGIVVLTIIILFAHRTNMYKVFRPRSTEAAN